MSALFGRSGMKQKFRQAGICLLCVALAWRYGAELEGTEFGGGRITGPLLDLYDVGLLFFILALLLTFFYLRIAAAIALAASLLCLPLYLDLAAPGPFRWVFRGQYSVPITAGFVWNRSNVVGILSLSLATCVSVGNLFTRTARPQ